MVRGRWRCKGEGGGGKRGEKEDIKHNWSFKIFSPLPLLPSASPLLPFTTPMHPPHSPISSFLSPLSVSCPFNSPIHFFPSCTLIFPSSFPIRCEMYMRRRRRRRRKYDFEYYRIISCSSHSFLLFPSLSPPLSDTYYPLTSPFPPSFPFPLPPLPLTCYSCPLIYLYKLR